MNTRRWLGLVLLIVVSGWPGLFSTSVYPCRADEVVSGLPPPTRVQHNLPTATVRQAVTALSQSGGVQLDTDPLLAERPCPLSFHDVPFWQAIDQLAARVQGRWLVSADGRSLRLVPRGSGQTIASLNGPFRLVVQAVTARLVPELAASSCDIRLLVHWEPQYAIYRMDSVPRITVAIDDRGQALQAETGKSYQYPLAASGELMVRLHGVQRSAQRLARLEGDFHAIIAERLLNVVWNTPPQAKPVSQTVEMLQLTWKSMRKIESLELWEVELEWLYPSSHPAFDSFEESKWLRDVQLIWRMPDGKIVRPQGEDIYASGRQVRAVCQFPTRIDPMQRGWALILVTPAPLREVKVPFRLENVPLP
ncbi:MAG: hypothetical protein NZU63_07615 [Gemmataceae bacterium]|nr:hypothetical protein [Gemmataceae bacterium]MDW8243547.1 hypothetical protein [Thermogemmata sp.]